MNNFVPDNWVVLKIQTDADGVIYKVLAGCSGGYLYGDSWRMNSGITKVVEKQDSIEFYGNSGSCYECYKGSYGLRMNNAGIYNQLKEAFGDTIELMAEDTKWVNLVQ